MEEDYLTEQDLIDVVTIISEYKQKLRDKISSNNHLSQILAVSSSPEDIRSKCIQKIGEMRVRDLNE